MEEWARLFNFDCLVDKIRIGKELVVTTWLENGEKCYGVFRKEELELSSGYDYN